MAISQERDRITARVSKNIKEDIETAAAMVGSKLNEFIVQAALSKAHEIIERDSVIKLNLADAELVFAALENPPQPNANLQSAVNQSKDLDLA